MSKDIIISGDGSHTLLSKEFGVHYHSIFGALDESIHVFIAAGLYYQYRQGKHDISIFEMGFGTGLNAWLTALESSTLGINVEYTGVELYPVDLSVIEAINYQDQLPISAQEKQLFKQLHEADWGSSHQITPSFKFGKHKQDIHDFEFDHKRYDVIYFDAFAPSAQGELWEIELHQKIYDALKPGGCLVSYCAKGVFKRMLKSLGYQLDPLNGPARKHEMTRAIKS